MTSVIRTAAADEAEDVARLISLAYRVEDFFVDGDRTNPAEVRALMERGVFLLLEDPPPSLSPSPSPSPSTAAARPGTTIGAVYVTIDDDRGFFAMLSIHPAHQRRGLGARLVAAVESYCRDAGCRHMDLHVVSLRTELPPFYRRLGYVEQGTAPFPPGAVLKMPCHVIVMTKPLEGAAPDRPAPGAPSSSDVPPTA